MILLALGVIRRSRIEFERDNLADYLKTVRDRGAQILQEGVPHLTDRQQANEIHGSLGLMPVFRPCSCGTAEAAPFHTVPTLTGVRLRP